MFRVALSRAALLPGPALLLALTVPARADVLSVGPNGTYAAPCAAFAAAADGDTIEIDSAGTYDGDVCPISKNQLHIIGTPGLAKIDANGMDSGGKGIWVIQGDDTTVENIEFSGAAVPDMNGAGIRQEGTNLTVRGCSFHDNENGILGGDGSEILIEYSEFEHNGAGDGYSHNLYIGHAKKLTFRHNWSHRSVIGHLLKSRAAENYILYNRITCETDGTSSYELNFPNGGKTYVIGNLIQQGPETDNPSLLAYLEEGESPDNPSRQLYVVNNTFVNERESAGTFLQLDAAADPAVVTNNIFFGGGSVTNQGSAVLSHNYSHVDSCLLASAAYDYHLKPGTPCVDAGVAPGDGDGFALEPSEHYVHPRGTSARSSVGVIDTGAYELGGETTAEGGAGNASAGSGPDQGGGGVAPGGSGTDPGGGGSGSSGGAALAGTGGGETSGGGRGSDDSGCGCRATSGKASGTAALAASLLLLGAFNRRRRRLRAREWPSQSPSRPSHPGWLRCSSVTYQQYAPSSRLASRAPRPRSSTDLAFRAPLAIRGP